MEFDPADTTVPTGKLPTRLEPFHDSRARNLFCKALEEYTPEVLDILHSTTLPVYRAVTDEAAKQSYAKTQLRPIARVGLDVDPSFKSPLPLSWWRVEQGASNTAEAQALYSAVINWRDQVHLKDEWLLDLAMQTLYHWRQQVESGHVVQLKWQRRPVANFSGLFDGQGEEFLFRYRGWDVEDDWQDFKKAVEKAFRKELAAYHQSVVSEARAGGWDEAPDIREKCRFGWLALRQVRGLSTKKIHCSPPRLDVSFSNIEKQINRSAKEAGVTPRPVGNARRKNFRN